MVTAQKPLSPALPTCIYRFLDPTLSLGQVAFVNIQEDLCYIAVSAGAVHESSTYVIWAAMHVDVEADRRGEVVHLTEAEVSEIQEKGPLDDGNVVQVRGIAEADDLYGVLVDVQYGRKHFVFPLCDLTVRNKKSPNHTPVQDYCVWFANR